MVRICSGRSPSRSTRRQTTSRRLSGSPSSAIEDRSSRRPSGPSAIAPDSVRWRRISATKNGFPSVSSATSRASSRPGVVHLEPRRRGHQLRDLIDSQSLQRAVLDAVQPVQVRERAGQRMAAVEVRLSIDHQHEQGGVRCCRRDVLEQREGLAVRPVQVIEHQQHRAVVARRLQEPRNRLEQQVALGLGVGLLRLRDCRRPAWPADRAAAARARRRGAPHARRAPPRARARRSATAPGSRGRMARPGPPRPRPSRP